MRISKFILLSFFLFLAFPVITNAQFISKNIAIGDTTQVHVLNTENGDRFVGRVTKIENTTIFFLFQEEKELEFNLSEVRSLVLDSEILSTENNQVTINKTVVNPDYDRARAEYYERRKNKSEPAILNGEENLFFSPTSYTLGKGEKEYRSVMIIYNRFDIGLTDNVDIGFDLMPLIETNIFAARIKAGIPLGDFFNVGFGSSVFIAQQSNFNNRDVTGTTQTYGTATFGSREKFVNIGFGYAFPFRPDQRQGASILTFGGALRISNHWKLIADFLLLSDDNQPDFYSVGASWFTNKHRIDFGINAVYTGDSFLGPVVPLPFAAYAFTFGKK